MKQVTTQACWFPPELLTQLDAMPGGRTPFIKRYQRNDKTLDVTFERLSKEALQLVITFLREKQAAVLEKRSVQEIAEALDQAAEKWLDPGYPPRQQAIEQISALTGFSPEMVAHSIDLEQISSRKPHLIQALINELGKLEYLDGFQPNAHLGGFTRAFGPGLVGAIFSSNIPALPHLEVMRAFLVKAACLGRVSAGEPIFLARYAQTLAEIDPEIASCLAVVYWEHDDLESETLFLESIGYLVAYGSDKQIHRLMSAKPPYLEATWHGHKLGFVYLPREALTRQRIHELADRVSYDFSTFDGHACLCPQLCFVEKDGEVSPAEFARRCATAMASWVKRLPPRQADLSEAAKKYSLRELYLMRQAEDEEIKVIAAPEDHSFMVVYERPAQFEPSPAERFLRLVPVDDLEDLERFIKPLRHYLQCAGVAAVTRETTVTLRNRLAALGVLRIVPPGFMGTPSMMWHHDGVACLSKMLTWCDNELALPKVLLTANVERLMHAGEASLMASPLQH